MSKQASQAGRKFKAIVAAVDSSVRDMCVNEFVQMDMRLEDNRIAGYHTQVKASFTLE